MNNPILFFTLLFFCPILGYVLIVGLNRLPGLLNKRHGRRLMDSLKPSEIIELNAGPAEINGRAQADTELVVSPLSQSPCVFYRLQVEEFHVLEDVPDSEDNFALCFDYCEPKKFTVKDSTGTIDVATDNATIELNPDGQWTGTIPDAPDHLKNLLETKFEKGFHRTFFGFKLGVNQRVLRFTECLVQEGDSICIIGQAIPQADGKMAIKDGCIPSIITEQNPDIPKQMALNTVSLSRYLWGGLVVAIAFTICLITLIRSF